MSLITFRVEDDSFELWLDSLQYKMVEVMKATLLNIAHTVEMQGRKYVPVDTTRLEMSYRAVTLSESANLIEIQMGYSALNPKDNYDYAEYTHIGIDYRTGKPLRFQKTGATSQYLFKAVDEAMVQGWQEIEGDYLSLFRG